MTTYSWLETNKAIYREGNQDNGKWKISKKDINYFLFFLNGLSINDSSKTRMLKKLTQLIVSHL